jgi:hypothetical protein
MLNSNNNIKSTKIQELYQAVSKNGCLSLDEIECFSCLKQEELAELVKLSMDCVIDDSLMPYFLMNYNTEVAKSLNLFFSDEKINQLLLETWNVYFQNKNFDKLNQFYLFIPLFSSDLIIRIGDAIDNDTFYNEFYDFIKEYSEKFVFQINDGSFYSLFDIDALSEPLISDNVNSVPEYFLNLKRNIEFFYYTQSYLNNNIGLLSSRKDKKLHQDNLDCVLLLYPYIENKKFFFNSKDLKSIEKKISDNEEITEEEKTINKRNSEVAAYTPNTFLKNIKQKLFYKNAFTIKDNGSIQCKDGHFRKPTTYNDVIISNKNTPNFIFIFVLFILTLFLIFGTFSLNYLDKNTDVLTKRDVLTHSPMNINTNINNNIVLKSINN